MIGLFGLYLDLYLDFNRDKQSALSIVNTGFIIALFLISFGFLLGIYWQRIASEKSELRTLTIQHDFSVQLASAKDWDDILLVVSKFITSFISISTAHLFIHDPKTESYQRVSVWASEQPFAREYLENDPLSLCEACLSIQNLDNQIKPCNRSGQAPQSDDLNSFCLPLKIKDQQIGVLRISLAQAEPLVSRQVELLKLLIPYLAIIVQAAIQRQALFNLSVVTATENERRTLTHDLHDTLGQNLSFLRLKLDQMIRTGHQGQNEKFQKDLDQMLMVAAESCELVQETLIILDPDESPPLSKILKSTAKSLGHVRIWNLILASLESQPTYPNKPSGRCFIFSGKH